MGINGNVPINFLFMVIQCIPPVGQVRGLQHLDPLFFPGTSITKISGDRGLDENQ